jgi:hypothetical protein
MTPEQKAKMAEGRRRAAEARKAVVAEPAGHKRDEAARVLKDAGQEAVQELADQTDAIAIDAAKLTHIDNEIAAHWDAARGDIPITKPQLGRAYCWATHEDAHGDAAKTSIRAMHAELLRGGWKYVEGDMPEGKEFAGKAHCAGTTQRGVGDSVLMYLEPDAKERLDDRNKRKMLLNMGIEKDFIEQVMQNTRGAAMGFDLNDPRMAKMYGAERMKPVAYSANFSQQNIREGTGPLKPGFELNRGR